MRLRFWPGQIVISSSPSLGFKADPCFQSLPPSSLLRHHVLFSLLSDFRSAQTPAALPTIAPCVWGLNAPMAIAVRDAW